MSIQITARHTEIDDFTRERIETKADKLKRFFDRINEINIVLAQEKFLQVVEVVLHCDGVKVKAQEANEELLTALDRVFEKVERQIKRYKKRLIDTRRRSAPRRTLPVTETVMAAVPDEEPEAPPDKTVGHIIDVEHRELLALTPEDAAMHLDLSGDPFFIFLNRENHHINVIHLRPDGHCGLIEPVVGPDGTTHA
jgi:putative sigma-54 modulation protein